MDSYSQLKPAWHVDRIETLRRGGVPAPVHVQIILSDLCNQDCGFCAYRMSDGLSTELFGTAETHNPNRQIPTAKAIEIIEDCAELGVKAIQFTGGGEPTVHKDHLTLFQLAQNLGMKTALVTNGVRLTTCEATMSMAWIRVSLDAGTPETYAAVRRVSKSHWPKVWENVERLARGYEGVLGIGYVVTDDNYREISEAATLAHRAGAQNMRVGAVFSEAGLKYYSTPINEIADEIARAKAEHPDFEIIDLFGRRLGDLEHGSPKDEFCGYQHFTMYIGGDLNVYRCCNTAYTKAGLVGSLKEQSLKDAVLNYAPFDARSCRYCQFLHQNETINALLKEPEHVEFV